MLSIFAVVTASVRFSRVQ